MTYSWHRSIKRIIFETAVKHNGRALVPLEVAHVKQIAGRAGRYRTAVQDMSVSSASDDAKSSDQATPKSSTNLGLVTTLEEDDLSAVKMAMEADPLPITRAGIFPPFYVFQQFVSYFPPSLPFSYMLLRLHEMSRIHGRFFLCNIDDQLAIADAIEPVKDMLLFDRYTFISAPVPLGDAGMREVVQGFAKCVAQQSGGELLDIPEVQLDVLDEPLSGKKEYLKELETLHKALTLYLWLSYRFGGVFVSRDLAQYAKTIVEDTIHKALTEFSADPNIRATLKARRASYLEFLKEHPEALEQSQDQGREQVGDEPLVEKPEDELNLDERESEPQVVPQPFFKDVKEGTDPNTDTISSESSTEQEVDVRLAESFQEGRPSNAALSERA